MSKEQPTHPITFIFSIGSFGGFALSFVSGGCFEYHFLLLLSQLVEDVVVPLETEELINMSSVPRSRRL